MEFRVLLSDKLPQTQCLKTTCIYDVVVMSQEYEHPLTVSSAQGHKVVFKLSVKLCSSVKLGVLFQAHVVIGEIQFLVFLEPRQVFCFSLKVGQGLHSGLKIFCHSLPWPSSSESGSLICKGQQEGLLLLSAKVDRHIMSHNLGVTVLSPLTCSISTSIQKQEIAQRCGEGLQESQGCLRSLFTA